MNGFRRKEVYSPSDISGICGVAFDEVCQWIKKGELPHLKIPGGHFRVRHDALNGFMDQKGMAKPDGWEGLPEKFRVLIVEDDSDLLEIIAEVLKDEPMLDIKTESSGFTAGLQIAGWQPDLLLLDFLMPGVSGFEICSRLREGPQTRDLPVLAVTSLTTDECRKAVCDSGVSDFLGKPFHSDALLEKVRILLGVQTPKE